jgi:hypothetical protein
MHHVTENYLELGTVGYKSTQTIIITHPPYISTSYGIMHYDWPCVRAGMFQLVNIVCPDCTMINVTCTKSSTH